MKKNNMLKLLLIFSIAASTLMEFSPLVLQYLTTHLGFPTAVGHMRLAVLLPGLILLPGAVAGSVSFFGTRLFAELLPATACALLVIIGILWVEPSERERGLIIAASIALTFLYAALIVENKWWDICAKTFVASAVIVFLLICLLNSGSGFGTFVINGFEFTNRNGVAMMFAFAIFLLLSMHFRGALFPASLQKSRAVTIALLLLFSAGVIMTRSRTGFVLFVVPITFLVYANSTKRRYLTTAGSLACILCWSFLICQIQTALAPQHRSNTTFVRLTSGNTLFTVGDRTKIWHSGFSHMLRYPRHVPFGVGTGGADAALGKEALNLKNGTVPLTDREIAPRFISTGCGDIPRLFPHALWLDWFMCYGILGTILAVFFVVFALSRAIRLDRRDGISDRLIFFVFLILANNTAITTRLPFSLVIGSLFLAGISNQLSFPVYAKE